MPYRQIVITSILFLYVTMTATAQPLSCDARASATDLLNSGVYFENAGAKTVAIHCYDLARRLEPFNYRFHRLYIRVAHQLGRQQDIFEEYNKPAFDPRFEVPKLILLSRLHESDAPKSLEYAAEAVQREPDNVWALNALGAAYYTGGREEEAIRILEDAYKRFDAQPETALILANALQSGHKSDPRVFDLLARAEGDPYYRPYARAFRAHSLVQSGDRAAGFKILQDNAREYEQFGLSYHFLAKFKLDDGNLEEAKMLYLRAIAFNITDVVFHNNAAWDILHASTEKPDAMLATELANAAVRLSGRRSATVLDTLAEGVFRLGDKQQAARLAMEALALPGIGSEDKAHIERQLARFQAAN